MQRKLRSVLFNRNFPPQDRPVGGLNEQKLKYAHETEHISTLAEVVKNVKPTAIIGKILQPFFLRGVSNASFSAPETSRFVSNLSVKLHKIFDHFSIVCW